MSSSLGLLNLSQILYRFVLGVWFLGLRFLTSDGPFDRPHKPKPKKPKPKKCNPFFFFRKCISRVSFQGEFFEKLRSRLRFLGFGFSKTTPLKVQASVCRLQFLIGAVLKAVQRLLGKNELGTAAKTAMLKTLTAFFMIDSTPLLLH